MRHPQFNTFVQQPMRGLSGDVRAARRHLQRERISYRYAARLIGVSGQMVYCVLTGRKRSARVLTAVMGLSRQAIADGWSKLARMLEEAGPMLAEEAAEYDAQQAREAAALAAQAAGTAGAATKRAAGAA